MPLLTNPTNIIDLKGNVKINSQDGQTLETDQLYFDQKNEWFFTEKSFKFTDPKGVSNGKGIDFSKDFKVINSQRIDGEVLISRLNLYITIMNYLKIYPIHLSCCSRFLYD